MSDLIGYLLVFALVFGFSLLLFNPTFLNKRTKAVDLIIWSVGGVGIIAAVLSVHTAVLSQRLELYPNWAKGYATAAIQIKLESRYWCNPYEHSEFSPANFDKIVIEQVAVCEWLPKAQEAFENVNLSSIPELPTIVTNGYPVTVNGPFESDRKNFLLDIEFYREFRSEFLGIKNRTDSSSFFYNEAVFISPYFLIFAFALSGAKIIRRNEH